jgi:hypothetical protein
MVVCGVTPVLGRCASAQVTQLLGQCDDAGTQVNNVKRQPLGVVGMGWMGPGGH